MSSSAEHWPLQHCASCPFGPVQVVPSSTWRLQISVPSFTNATSQRPALHSQDVVVTLFPPSPAQSSGYTHSPVLVSVPGPQAIISVARVHGSLSRASIGSQLSCALQR